MRNKKEVKVQVFMKDNCFDCKMISFGFIFFSAVSEKSVSILFNT